MPSWRPCDLSDRPTVSFNHDRGRTTSKLNYDPDGNTGALWKDRKFDGMDPAFLPEDLSASALLFLPWHYVRESDCKPV